MAPLTSDDGGLPDRRRPSVVAGSRDESITQPEWHADGSLWFLSDRSDWWNLYRIDVESSSSPVPAGASPGRGPVRGRDRRRRTGCSPSPRYAFLADGRVAVAYAADGIDHLAVVDPGLGGPAPGAAATLSDLDTDFVALGSLQAYGHGLVFAGGSAGAETVVAIADLPRHGDATIGVIRPSAAPGARPGLVRPAPAPHRRRPATAPPPTPCSTPRPIPGPVARPGRPRPCWC